MKRFLHIVLLLSVAITAVRAAIVEYDLPHTFTMDRLKELPLMTIVDANNDGNKWAYTVHGDYTVMYILTDEKAADDWLILPAVKMKKSHVTRMRYTMRTAAENLSEAFEIKAGTTKSVAGMTISVVPRKEISSAYYTVYEATIAVPEDGAYHIGFHAMSAAGSSAIVLDNVELEQGPAADIPKPVSEFVTTSVQGSYDAVLSFTAPTATGSGSPLTAADIVGIQIQRDGTTITTLTGVQPGEKLTYTDRNTPNGDHEYSIVVHGKSGESDAVKSKIYVGYDVPYSPRNVNVEAQDDCVLVSWNAVGSEGTHYHYVDPARITYNIYLYDEENGEYVKVATTPAGATSYRYNVNPDEGPNQVLLFAVESADEQNGFISARREESPRIIVGKPYALPYDDDLSMNSPYSWFVLEEPVGTTTDGWVFGSTGGANNRNVVYVKCAYPTSEAEISTGKIYVKDAVKPVLTFQYYLGSIAYNDQMEVIITRSDSKDPIAVAVCDRFSPPSSEWIIKSVNLTKYITPETRWITVSFKAYGAPALQEGRDYQMLSNVRVIDVVDSDLGISLMSASSSLKYNGAMNMSVKVQNLGSAVVKKSDYAVVLYKNGKRVSEAENVNIQPFSEAQLSLRYECCGPDEDENLHFEARIESANDPVTANNSVATDVMLVRPQLPQISALNSSRGDASSVITLSWDQPQRTIEPVNEDFESYDAFSIGEEVLDDYTVYFKPQTTDYCGSGLYPHAGEAIGSLVFDNVKAGFGNTGAYAPHSGNQCLVVFNGEQDMDTWLITPELSGKAQTISFYTSALTGNWGPEEFNVLYSMKGIDKGDFKAINPVPLTEKDSWAWNARSFDVPEGAKFFAIQVVSKNKMGFKLDDLTFERVRGLDINILGYNVYVDGVLAATVSASDNPMTAIDLDHKAQVGVSIVTDWGEGAPYTVTVDPTTTGVMSLSNDDTVPVAYDVYGRKVQTTSRGLYIINGKKVVK